jgi:hypothetical protein
MECTISGQVQCDHVTDSRAFRKFTDKQIRNWITRKFAEAYRRPITYFVEIRRPGAGHSFDCHIKVRAGNQVWVGSNFKTELHQSLIHCLRQMYPLPRPA